MSLIVFFTKLLFGLKPKLISNMLALRAWKGFYSLHIFGVIELEALKMGLECLKAHDVMQRIC